MVARLSPLYELTDGVLIFILYVGSITAFFLGLVALVQNDIKRIIAYSTISQLGYMTAALGASLYSLAMFHLITHAFFKALLFLCAGSIIIKCHHEQDIRKIGGLRKYMPITYLAFMYASLSLIGFPITSGFYSKESIIDDDPYRVGKEFLKKYGRKSMSQQMIEDLPYWNKLRYLFGNDLYSGRQAASLMESFLSEYRIDTIEEVYVIYS